jgi:pimeloyl-ACP methyl ester carboxylesterase
MHPDSSLKSDRVIREWSKFRSAVGYERAIFLWCVLSLCLFCGCIHPDEARYLSAAEIQDSIIGNSLKEAESDSWKEDYLAIDGNRLKGIIKGRSKISVPYRGTWSIDGYSMCINYPGAPDQGGCYRFSRGSGNNVLWFDEAGALAFESELIERDDPAVVVNESLLPPYRQETVTFQHGDNMLVADLNLPAGPAPYPAVVIVHGSGAASRHDWAFGGGRTIRDEFLHRGFATLVWSKPGVDESTGDYLKQTMAMRAEEVAAAMTHLAEREDINGDQIGLSGGSQAGWVMPMVPGHRNVAFVIAVSCPAQAGQEQDLYLVNNELAGIGISEEDRADALEHRRAFYDLIRESVDYEEFQHRHEEWLKEMKRRSWYSTVESRLDELVSQEIVLSPGRQEFEYLFINLANDANRSLTPPPQLKNFYMPVLAIYGTKDSVVDWKLGSKAYEEIPRIAGNPDVTVILFEGADHGIAQPDSEGYMAFAPGYITTMGEWLSAHR